MTVSGEGMVTTGPDMAVITAGVLSENKSLQVAQSENSDRSQKVIDALLQLGIPREDIQTVEYRINNMYDYVDGKQIFRGYEVRHLLEVQVSDISQVGKVVDTVIANGANIIYNIRFDTSRRTELYNEALTKALQDAISKAESLAKLLNVQLNRIPFEITESQTTIGPIIPYQTFAVEKVAGASTPIEPGTLEIKAVLLAKFYY